MTLDLSSQVLQQRYDKMESERDQLYSKFEASIYSVQQKTGVRNLLLEKKLNALGGVLEHKEAQLAEVMAASNLDPATLAQLNTVRPWNFCTHRSKELIGGGGWLWTCRCGERSLGSRCQGKGCLGRRCREGDLRSRCGGRSYVEPLCRAGALGQGIMEAVSRI